MRGYLRAFLRHPAVQHPATLRRVALASIVGNVAIVITGGAVRLTDSGLGCPTWPRCTDDSYTTTRAMGIHGVIEFGNRTLAFVLGVIVLAALIVAYAQRDRRPRALRPALLSFLGVPAQGLLGGITVLTGLNPWIVGAHFLLSMGIIAAAHIFWVRAGDPADPVPVPIPGPLRTLAWLAAGACALVLVLGTVVTGSGPHAGDADTGRNGLSAETMSQLHADGVFLLLGLSIALWYALRAVSAGRAARVAGILVLVELSQGVVGFVQYLTGLPEIVVGVHLLGACLVWLATVATLTEISSREVSATTRPAADGEGTRRPSGAASSRSKPRVKAPRNQPPSQSIGSPSIRA